MILELKFHFYEDKPYVDEQFGPDEIINFNFEFVEDGDTLTKIKTCINEKLENLDDFFLPSDFVKIIIVYKINHNYF